MALKNSPGIILRCWPVCLPQLLCLLTCHNFHLFLFHFAFKVLSAAVKRNKTDKSRHLHSGVEWESAKGSQMQVMKLLFGHEDCRCVDICCRIINEIGKIKLYFKRN